MLVLVDKTSNSATIVCERYYVKGILKETGFIGHGNKTYCKSNKSCDELIDQNIEYTKRFVFKVTEKK